MDATPKQYNCPKCGIAYYDDRRASSGNPDYLRGGFKPVSREEMEQKCDQEHMIGEECGYWQQPEIMNR
jgi:hypothetical protein